MGCEIGAPAKHGIYPRMDHFRPQTYIASIRTQLEQGRHLSLRLIIKIYKSYYANISRGESLPQEKFLDMNNA